MRTLRGLVIFLLLAICQIVAIIAPIRGLYWVFRNQDQAFEVVKGYDRLGNAAANGKSNETISSRANRARAENRRWGCILCRILDWVQKDHCKDAAGV